MLHLLRARLTDRREDDQDGGEEGFTLIELMVVVLIIAILIAIAIPTFLGARQKAQDRAAQSNLRNALTAVKTQYVDTQDYTASSVTEYNSIEPSLSFVSGATASGKNNDISVNTVSASEVVLSAHSASGQCFYVDDKTANTGAGTTYAKGSDGGGGTCNASATGLTFTGSW